MGPLDRVRRLEDARRGGPLTGAGLTLGVHREALRRLTDEELDALEESLNAEARSRGEEPPPNDYLEQMKEWEAEAIEQQLRNAEESRRRGRELLNRNRARCGLPPLETEIPD